MPPTRNPEVACCDDVNEDITVQARDRIAEGYFVAWKAGEILCWGRLGASIFPAGCDTVALNPADYRRLMEMQARFDAEKDADGRA